MSLFHKMHHLVGGTLLVAGTSIGVGMLALPVATAAGGFLPATLVYLVCWLFMVTIGLLIVEASLWCPTDSNLITISKKLLGPIGSISCWILYLFLLYCLMVAHTAIGGEATMQIFPSLPSWAAATIYVVFFGSIVYLGTLWVGRLNALLMIGLILAFILFLTNTFTKINFSLLTVTNWKVSLFAIPTVFTAFGFQTLIPTLITYMQRDIPKVRIAIWLGTALPLVLYLIWELLILGIVPLSLLEDAATQGQNAVVPLQTAVQSGFISTIGQIFAFFAMTTSFIGLAIAFFDFLADGLKWEKKGFKKAILAIFVFLIPLLIVFIDPSIFLHALNLAGGVGVGLLLGVLPVLFIWSGRYRLNYPLTHQFVKGGRFTLTLLFLFSLFTIILGLI
jgi:tyrosine-specific transport protein